MFALDNVETERESLRTAQVCMRAVCKVFTVHATRLDAGGIVQAIALSAAIAGCGTDDTPSAPWPVAPSAPSDAGQPIDSATSADATTPLRVHAGDACATDGDCRTLYNATGSLARPGVCGASNGRMAVCSYDCRWLRDNGLPPVDPAGDYVCQMDDEGCFCFLP